MAAADDGFCFSVGGLAVEMGWPVRPEQVGPYLAQRAQENSVIRCKCRVSYVTNHGSKHDVVLRPVWDPNPESPNFKWSQATPDGEIRLGITNPAAFGQFEPGQEVYVDLHVVKPPQGPY